MTSAAIRKIEQRWQLPFWTLVANLAEQGLSRADSARALGLNPHSFRYHLTAHPELDPFPPVVRPPRDYAADTGETFREACIRMSATHTITQAARETGYADSSCFKRALRARGLDLQFQKHVAKRKPARALKVITREDVEQYANLRLSGMLHTEAAGRVGFSDNALRHRLKQFCPDLWVQVKRLGCENSGENRRKIKAYQPTHEIGRKGQQHMMRREMNGRCDVCGRARGRGSHDKCSKLRQTAGFIK